jgi:hypothetical protein
MKLEELAAEMSNVAATVGGLKSFEIDKLPAGDDL